MHARHWTHRCLRSKTKTEQLSYALSFVHFFPPLHIYSPRQVERILLTNLAQHSVTGRAILLPILLSRCSNTEKKKRESAVRMMVTRRFIATFLLFYFPKLSPAHCTDITVTAITVSSVLLSPSPRFCPLHLSFLQTQLGTRGCTQETLSVLHHMMVCF